MAKRFILSLIAIISFSFSNAQDGIIRGSVFDESTGETLIGVTVAIDGTTKGAVTDIDGKFELRVQPGTYSLKISYVSYTATTIENTVVKAGEVTILGNIQMREQVSELEEITITAESIKTTEEALLSVKLKSTNLVDGISAANFRKIGDSDAASAVRRVPGVSVEGGKYVFVRGLGDRYTKSTLNGIDIPGLDPDRNTVQMDMFPTSLIDNIMVVKSFTSDLPGDFTGGIVNIDIKDFPEEKVFNVSLNGGFTPSMHFQKDYLTYKGGTTDFLGFDDGSRKIPTDGIKDIPLYPTVIARPQTPEGQQFHSILKKFNPTMAAMKETSFMDYGFGINFGNQVGSGRNKLGYNFSLTYRNSSEFYTDAEYGRYGKGSSSEYDLITREYQIGDYGVRNVMLSGLAGIALKRERAKYRLNLLHSQNGESKAGRFSFIGSELGANFEADQTNLEYSERSLTNLLLSGSHFNKAGNLHIDWKLAPTLSKITDPDIRFTRYRIDGGSVSIGSEVGYPERIWRFLDETNLAGKVDLTWDINQFRSPGKLKFGGGHTFKERDYNIEGFQIIPQNVPVTGNPDEMFYPEHLWPMNDSGTRGTRYEPSFIPYNTNAFNAYVNNSSAYVSNEFSITKPLKAIVGLRMETYQQFYTGLNQQRLQLTDEQVLDDLDLFPTVNLIYGIKEKQNVRVSYSKTVARPSLKEASYAEIFDPLTGRIFVGGFFPDINSAGDVIWDGKLTATRIDNFDLRWEAFQERGEMLSASVFYKTFDRPIEIIQFIQAPNNFQPRNVGDGQVAGLELEFRQNLDVITPLLKNFSVSSNATFAQSKIEMSPTEYKSRVGSAREGESIKNTRQMAGQSPYLINAGITFNGPKNLETGLYYNVQGKTLAYVGVADRPDVYAVPFNSLNFVMNKTFGDDERLQLGVNANNILNDTREYVFESFRAKDEVFSRFKPGMNFSFKVGYKF